MSEQWSEWRTNAEVEIRALVQRYNALGDSGRFNEFVDLFAPDAIYTVTGQDSYEGREGLHRLVSDASNDIQASGGEVPMYIRHFTSTHQIDFESEVEANGRVYYQCLMPPHGLDHWGRYKDRYRLVDGRWLFASRTENRDGMVEGGWCDQLWGPSGSRRSGGS